MFLNLDACNLRPQHLFKQLLRHNESGKQVAPLARPGRVGRGHPERTGDELPEVKLPSGGVSRPDPGPLRARFQGSPWQHEIGGRGGRPLLDTHVTVGN